MLAIALVLLLDPLQQVATVGNGDELRVFEVDRRPDIEVPSPDACAGEGPQPTLTTATFGTVADAWPDEVSITGVITGLVPGYLGFACNATALRIRVTEGPAAIRGHDLFIATWCIFKRDAPGWCGKAVQLRAHKLYRENQHCGVEPDTVGFLDSGGMPYYVVDDAQHQITVLSPGLSQTWPPVAAPNYWLKLPVRPVTGLACARPAPAWPAA
jgi:hypothetical protein